MERSDKVKGILSILFALGNYYYNYFNILVAVLICMVILDYVTGTGAALIHGKWDKKKAKLGMWEKFGFFILVVLGFTVDVVLTELGRKVQVEFSTAGFVGTAVTVWLIGTEGISNLQNLREWGVPIPPFLKKAFKGLQSEAENIVKDSSKK